MPHTVFFVCIILAVLFNSTVNGQDQSVKPGINDTFKDPNVDDFKTRFEVESREVFALRNEIVKLCRIKPGMQIADVGAGTGLYTRLFSQATGEKGSVFAVDISQKFLDHINLSCRENKMKNVQTILCTADDAKLPPNSVDLVFICDTYHHFEFPQKTLQTIKQGLKADGRIIVIDFKRIQGESSDWTMNHVRAGQEVFESEIIQSGFQKTREEKEGFKQNYFVEFKKSKSPGFQSPVFPIIEGYGGVVEVADSKIKPTAGARLVMNVTNNTPAGEVNKGLERAARLINLYGAAGLKASDIKISIVFHGDATKSVLDHEMYSGLYHVDKNPNEDLINKLKKAGVEIVVCGQALNYKGFPAKNLLKETSIADSALTFIVSKQAEGYGYLDIP